jgi:hypothetical protein
MAVADRHGLPVALCVESATPHEVKLAASTLVQMIVPEPPQYLIGDNAYDSDKLTTSASGWHARSGCECSCVTILRFAEITAPS